MGTYIIFCHERFEKKYKISPSKRISTTIIISFTYRELHKHTKKHKAMHTHFFCIPFFLLSILLRAIGIHNEPQKTSHKNTILNFHPSYYVLYQKSFF